MIRKELGITYQDQEWVKPYIENLVGFTQNLEFVRNHQKKKWFLQAFSIFLKIP